MGTQMQSETYFSRHRPRSFSRSISAGRWSSYQEGKFPKSSHHEDSSSPLSGLMDRYSGHDKAKVKEAILEHEAIFKHQVQELHRLYRRQRELMNAVQENKLCTFQRKAELSQSVIFPSFVASETAKRTVNESPFLSSDTMIRQLDPSRSIAGQSPSTVLKRNHCDSFNLCRDMYLHKPANLHISGDAHKYKEKTTMEGSSFSLVGNGVGCEDGANDPLRERASNSFFNNTAKYEIRAGDSESNMSLNGRNYLAYFSEPFQFFRSSSSVKSSCNLSCNTDTLKRQDLTANVTLGFSPKTETSQYSMPVINGQNFLSRPPSGYDSNRKEQKSDGFKFRTDLALDSEHNTEGRKKRKIFGVEIAEVDESPLVSSDANNSYPKSNGAESDTSRFLSTRASVRHFKISEPSWLKLGSSLQNLEFVGGKDARDASKYSVPKSNLFDTSSSCVHPQQNPELIDGGAASLDILEGNNAFTSLPELFEFRVHDSTAERCEGRNLLL